MEVKFKDIIEDLFDKDILLAIVVVIASIVSTFLTFYLALSKYGYFYLIALFLIKFSLDQYFVDSNDKLIKATRFFHKFLYYPFVVLGPLFAIGSLGADSYEGWDFCRIAVAGVFLPMYEYARYLKNKLEKSQIE